MMPSVMDTLSAKDLLDVHSKVNNPATLERIFEDYKNDIYMVSGRYTPIELKDDKIWTSDANDRSWLFWHHCLVSVAYLIDSYYVDENKEKLYLAYDIVNKWYDANYPSSLSVMGWHDHSTALRLLHIVKLYLVFLQRVGDEEILKELSKISRKHMEKLADPDFYMPKHNHGLDQDISLYIASFILKEIPDSLEWNKLAINRFWGQINNIFADDGSYLEHSPHYIYLMLERLLNFYNIMSKTNEQEGNYLKDRIIKITKFFIYTLNPDGTFPTIGDSESQSFDITGEHWSLLPKEIYTILQAIKKENNFEITLPLDSYYKDGGYAFFRSDWNNDENTVQMTFYSAFHSRVHKHHDDLSFILYGHGKQLLIDAGKFTYQYDRSERAYVTSTYGHNTVRINDSETDISRLNIGKSGILSFLSTNNIGFVSGFHTLKKGITHRRIIFYLKPGDILVLDLLKGKDLIKGEQIFNFNQDLMTIYDEDVITGYSDENEEIFLTDLIDNTPFIKSRGETDPFKGWSSNFYGEFKPNDLWSKEKCGNHLKFATLISLKKDDKFKDFKWLENEIHFKWKSFNVDLILTDYYEILKINGKVFKTIKNFNNPTLFEGITENEIELHRS
ncbi:hypothetical protein D1B31_15900 [Neobacillus notoginsengisoli]|uniref:Uncharacterized protein n=1 Tax=Neobacillus notoginsengisoli TaxID=1578198 RepID=A0A417YRF9_9BACI|nr:heparinase II/III family protein [Neobacillus notoginsengisoli]RHW37250.1 hypothetical protein D1B31_15900 [Neobacillus notoginsengisoli]